MPRTAVTTVRARTSRAKHRFILSCLAALTTASLSAPGWAEQPLDVYETLSEPRFHTEPLAVPAGGISWSVDSATWTLDSGSVWLQQAVAGKVPGLVFEGAARFELAVPDPYELRQLRRFAEQPELESFEQTFTRMVLRSEDALALLGLTGLEAASGALIANDLAQERREHWRKQQYQDPDGRLAAALRTAGDRYLMAEMDSADWGWMTYRFDALRVEEASLERYKEAEGYLESWVSLDRQEHRTPEGRPDAGRDGFLDLDHVIVKAELTERSNNPSNFLGGRSGESLMKGHFEVTVDFRSIVDGPRALPFTLHPVAVVQSIRDGEGRALAFARPRVGDRSTSPMDLYASNFWIFLPDPVERDVARQLVIDYDMELPNFAGGRFWYPTPTQTAGALTDLHTARFEFVTRSNYEVRAMGSRVAESSQKKLKTSVWQIDRPAKMVTFCWAQRHFENRMEHTGIPDVILFSRVDQSLTDHRLENVGIDVVNAINFFQQLFDHPLPNDTLYASMIDAGHGQAFDGYLHLAESSAVESPGATELFRAHEVAHQWWGHIVGWQSYRDQWLSEAFAEYSAMMFVEASVKKGDKHFQEMLKAYTDELNGSIKSAFSKFARPGVALLNKQGAERIGPISHGYRASTGDVQTGYTTLAYRKGPLVLHMIRVLLRHMTKSDDTFIAVLRDFVQRYDGKAASTEDFQAVLSEHMPRPWGWFFDQWVYGNAIPTYEWEYELGHNGERDTIVLTVRQSEVPEGFQMAVPVRAEFGGDRIGEVLIMVDEPEETFTIPLPARPRKVVFNPDNAVLAKMKKL